MSGGSYNYTCYRVESEYEGRMYDEELNALIEDLVEVLHDLEWWQSDDTCEETYRETVTKFKNKWLKQYNKDLCYDFCKYKSLASNIEKSLKEIKEMERKNG